METDMLHSAAHALLIILDPMRLLYLFGGVCMGLSLGILPGIGGIAGTALLLPFTYNLDPPTAFALLLGLGATTTTADPIAAILFGAPGHAASAATTLDGYPMTRRGEAGRALGASYMAALMGGLFGAAPRRGCSAHPAPNRFCISAPRNYLVWLCSEYRWSPCSPATRRCAGSPRHVLE